MSNIKSLLAPYTQWYLENTEFVSMIEKSLQFGQLLIPNRWSEHELQSDLYSAATNVVSSFHDYLWTAAAIDLQKNKQLPGNPQLPDDIREKLEKTPHFPESQLHHASLLSYISNSEILLELLAILGTDKNSDWSCIRNLRWTVVFVIEFVKVVIKFKMLSRSKGTMLAFQKLPSRTPKAPELRKQLEGDEKGEDDESTSDSNEVDWDELLNTGEARPTLQTVQKQLEAIKKQKRSTSTENPTSASFSLTLGEVLWIIRPLVYLLVLFRNDRRSWSPWVASAIVDFMSYRLLKRHEENFNKSELEEFQRRKGLWLFYLLRSPSPLVQILKSKTVSEGLLARGFSKLPGSDKISSLFWAILNITTERYFYSSGS